MKEIKNTYVKATLIFLKFIIFICSSLTVSGTAGTESGSGRQNSLEDMNLDQFLKTSNYEDTMKQLDIYYGIGWQNFYSINVI